MGNCVLCGQECDKAISEYQVLGIRYIPEEMLVDRLSSSELGSYQRPMKTRNPKLLFVPEPKMLRATVCPACVADHRNSHQIKGYLLAGVLALLLSGVSFYFLKNPLLVELFSSRFQLLLTFAAPLFFVMVFFPWLKKRMRNPIPDLLKEYWDKKQNIRGKFVFLNPRGGDVVATTRVYRKIADKFAMKSQKDDRVYFTFSVPPKEGRLGNDIFEIGLIAVWTITLLLVVLYSQHSHSAILKMIGLG